MQAHAAQHSEDASEVDDAPQILLADRQTIDLEEGSNVERWARLARLELEHADFQQRNYRGQRFVGLNLKGALLIVCDFTGANFTAASLETAQLEKSLLVGAVLRKAKLRQANLNETACMSADFSGVALDGITAVDANFDRAKFVAARLNNATLLGASFVAADLSNADLTGANLTGCNLAQANLNGACLSNAVLRQASLVGASLHEATLSETDLTHADLSDATLRDLKFGTKLCNFTGMCLANAKFAPQDLYRQGQIAELDVLLRCREELDEALLDHVEREEIQFGLGKLWLDHALSGSDILLQPIKGVFDAARAAGIALYKGRRR